MYFYIYAYDIEKKNVTLHKQNQVKQSNLYYVKTIINQNHSQLNTHDGILKT